MNNLKYALALLMTMTLIACSVTGSASDEKPLEVLHGLKFEKGMIELNVTSNGCTKPEDFDVHMSRNNGIQTLAISRSKADVCRKMPHQKTVQLKSPALVSGVPVRVLNPFFEARTIKRQ